MHKPFDLCAACSQPMEQADMSGTITRELEFRKNNPDATDETKVLVCDDCLARLQALKEQADV